MPQTYRTLVHRRFEEVWNQGREATAAGVLTKDSVAHGLQGDQDDDIRGPAAFKQFLRKFPASFPDLRWNAFDFLTMYRQLGKNLT